MSALGGVHGALGRFSLLLVVDSMLCHSEQLIDLSIEKDGYPEFRVPQRGATMYASSCASSRCV
jgi:hypothetical protein